MTPHHLTLTNIGQLKSADVKFGDLTVLVGPQATGKSIFLQWLKLLIDSGAVLHELKRFNIDWGGDWTNFLDIYFGEGMSSIWRDAQSHVVADGSSVSVESLTKSRGKKNEELMFFIPAQRVMSMRDGLTRPFTDYRAGDPFVLREFSERLHQMLQGEFGSNNSDLFPQARRLKAALRKLIGQNIFGEFGLQTDTDRFQRRVSLRHPETGKTLPYLVWSAGQREFVPLLLGFYWLMPPTKVSRRGSLEWVVIEELEMGLHPNGISAVLAVVLELIRRGYRVCLSTHSPHVLDVVWAIRVIQRHGGEERDILKLFKADQSQDMHSLATTVLSMKSRAYYFAQDGNVKDISNLDPAAEDTAEAGWGGLTEFSGHIGDVVADVVNRTNVGAQA